MSGGGKEKGGREKVSVGKEGGKSGREVGDLREGSKELMGLDRHGRK